MQRKFLLHTGAITSSVQILQFLPCSPRCYSSDPKCRLSAHVRRTVPNNLLVFVVRLCFSSCFLRCKFKFCAIFNHEERRICKLLERFGSACSNLGLCCYGDPLFPQSWNFSFCRWFIKKKQLTFSFRRKISSLSYFLSSFLWWMFHVFLHCWYWQMK